MCTGKVNPFMKLLVASLTLLSTLSFAQTVAQTAAAPDASGKWKVHLSVGGSDSEMECNFVQAGADLSGTCKGEAGEAKVTGKIDGQQVKWSQPGDYNGTALLLSFDGKLDGEKISGNTTVDPFGVGGTFDANKTK